MRIRWLAASLAVLMVTAGCNSSSGSQASPSATATTTTATSANVTTHESGPQSPIAFGVTVPKGAVQLGPLVRQRSQSLLDTYRPDLQAAIAEQNAKLKAQESNGTPSPSPSSATATSEKPEKDTFALLDDRPKPDEFTSYMRVTGNPITVVRRMLAELSALLPGSQITPNDLATYCRSANQRITGCSLSASGTTHGGRKVSVAWAVDPGNVTTRTGLPASSGDPVMTLTIAYIGDPREGQQQGFNESLPSTPKLAATEKSGLIWPKMDVDEPSTGALIGAWKAPSDCALLLTATSPQFVMLYTMKSDVAADAVANFFQTVAPGLRASKDVISDLNEVVIVQRGTRKDGERIQAIQVISARGTYVVVSVAPRG